MTPRATPATSGCTCGHKGDGGPVTIWSGSQSGYGPWYVESRLDDLAPEPPDLVLYSYGHLVAANEIAPSLGALHTALTEELGQVPTVVLLQSPGLAEDNAVHDAAADWAADTDLPTIDVAAAFQATGDLTALMDDGGQPNQAGSQLWADTVNEALTP